MPPQPIEQIPRHDYGKQDIDRIFTKLNELVSQVNYLLDRLPPEEPEEIIGR